MYFNKNDNQTGPKLTLENVLMIIIHYFNEFKFYKFKNDWNDWEQTLFVNLFIALFFFLQLILRARIKINIEQINSRQK